MPGRCSRSATPSTFQNAVAPATRPASSALTAWKPIVVVRTLPGSPPSPATTERSTASSDGRPLTPARSALEVRGRADRRLREHRRERPLHERHHADDVAPLLAREPEVVDVEDRHVGASGLEQLERVGRRARLADLELDALRLVVAALGRHVEPGVDRVRREVEQQRRLGARPVLAGGRAAAAASRPRRRPASRTARRARIQAEQARRLRLRHGCAAGSRSRATSRCRCRGRACRTASTARSRRTGRTCTSPRRSSGCSTAPRGATSRSCWC